jgi:uncharacterized membrane protein (UPF0127 family)
MMRSIRLNWKKVLYLTALGLAVSWCVVLAQTTFPILELQVEGHRIDAEVAATADVRDFGLMSRYSLSDDRGMLFVFPDARKHCMWMKDTFIPLSVAFIDDNGKIVSIAEMQPRSLAFHCAPVPVRYALEMNKAWFSKRRIGCGASFIGLNNAPPGL